MDLPPNLDTLPNELVARICSYLDKKKDITHLRLVRKQIHPFVTETFAKRYLSNPYVIMSRYSLQALADICKHPHFGPHVRKVAFYAKRCCPGHLDNLARSYKESFAAMDSSAAEVYSKTLQSYIALCQEGLLLVESGEARKLINDAFNSLGSHGNAVKILIQNWAEECNNEPIGSSRQYKDHALLSGYDYTQDYLRTPLKMLTEAASLGGCKINGLQIRHGRFCSDPELFEEGHIAMPEDFATVYSSLEAIDLDLDFRLRDYSISSLKRLFSQAAHLEELRCYLTTDMDRRIEMEVEQIDAVDEVLGSNTSVSLHEVELCNMGASQNCLVALLKRNKTSLQKLSLRRFGIRRGSWGLIFQWIRDTLSLEELKIGALYVLDDNHVTPRGYIPEPWFGGPVLDYKGRKAVRLGLESLLEKYPE